MSAKEIAQVVAGERKWHVEQGDCRDLLRLLQDNCVDAIVIDLPYEIGFMSATWDRTGIAFDVAMWKEALRVLKPGGHILSFGGTRTYHRMACAIEDAGAWFRDQIDWLYAQGMPKGQNVNKFAYGVCRCEEVSQHDVSRVRSSDVQTSLPVGDGEGSVLFEGLPEQGPSTEGEVPAASLHAWSPQPGMEGWRDDSEGPRELQGRSLRAVSAGTADDGAPGQVYSGASTGDGAVGGQTLDERRGSSPRKPRLPRQRAKEPRTLARQQESQASGAWPICGRCGQPRLATGLGTGLKPSHEPIAMAMKPLDGTFEHNVRKWGTGAINVDACRVGTIGGTHKFDAPKDSSVGVFGDGLNGGGGKGREIDAGRWPANLILSHAEGCQRVGVRKVKVAPPWNDNRPPSLFTGAETSPVHHTDGDGFETVDDYRCVEGCPVGMLDGQSGVSGPSGRPNSYGNVYRNTGFGDFGHSEYHNLHLDSGGASRYFTTFPYEPFFYEPKASQAERERGCEWMDEEVVDDGRHTPNDTPYQRGKKKRKNTHTTVKPVGVIRWCTRLVCRRGGLVLDMTCGSGTGGIAALAEGCRWIGFELKPKHVEIAIARIIGDAPLLNTIGAVR